VGATLTLNGAGVIRPGRGWGKSSKPESGYTVANFAADVDAFPYVT
jgi:hypothetical protein